MSYRQTCPGCYCVISEYSRQYFCCDLEQPVCYGCRGRPCPRCANPRRELPVAACKVCRRPTPVALTFQEPMCQARFCSRCVSGLYLPLLMGGGVPASLELNCGHATPRKELQLYLVGFCVNCGGRGGGGGQGFYELQGGMRLCERCQQCEGGSFFPLAFVCINCEKLIRSRAEAYEYEELTLCRGCADSQGLIGSLIEESRTRLGNSRTTNLVGSRGEGGGGGEGEDSETSIVSRFSAFDVVDRDESSIRRAKGRGGNSLLKMASKNSVEIRVEDFKIRVGGGVGKGVRCAMCGMFVEEDAAIRREQSNGKVCKICYCNNVPDLNERERPKHISLPKHRPPTVQPAPTPPPFPSPNPPTTTPTQPRLSQTRPARIPIVSPPRPQPEPWQSLPSSKACQLCSLRSYIITRTDGVRVCLDCHRKR